MPLQSTFSLEKLSISVNGTSVVADVSLTLAPGELHVLMGPNGSGKSSLLSGVFGHPSYRITEGRIFLDNEEITDIPTEEKARKGLFLSLQHIPEIPGVTLLQFLHQAIRARDGDRAPSVVDLFRTLEGKAKEVGVDPSFLRRPVGSGLSGGEKKQAEMLQLLALEPRFAFLDEIDSGVDVDAMARIVKGMALLRARGTGILWVTHHVSLLEKVKPDHISVMQAGHIMETGDSDLAAKIAREGFGEKKIPA